MFFNMFFFLVFLKVLFNCFKGVLRFFQYFFVFFNVLKVFLFFMFTGCKRFCFFKGFKFF